MFLHPPPLLQPNLGEGKRSGGSGGRRWWRCRGDDVDERAAGGEDDPGDDVALGEEVDQDEVEFEPAVLNRSSS